MKIDTEEWLHTFSWTQDPIITLTNPDISRVYESWLHSLGTPPNIRHLQRINLLIKNDVPGHERLLKLTESAHIRIMGGRHPENMWARKWDGKWRMILFNMSQRPGATRIKFWRFLKNHHLGCLQKSVWITPDPLDRINDSLIGIKTGMKSLLCLDASPTLQGCDSDLVTDSWDFDKINSLYNRHLQVLQSRPSGRAGGKEAFKPLRQWMNQEYRAWRAAIDEDPLLPEQLLPASYLGQKSWHLRLRELKKIKDQLTGALQESL